MTGRQYFGWGVFIALIVLGYTMYLSIASTKAAKVDCFTGTHRKAGCQYLQDTSWLTLHPYAGVPAINGLVAGLVVAVLVVFGGSYIRKCQKTG